MTGATELLVPAGSTVHAAGESTSFFKIVLSGLVRVHVTALDGRTMTVRYCRPGSLLGVVSLFASPFTLPASIQAVTNADLLVLVPSVVCEAAERDVLLANALLGELSERVLSFIAEISGSAFTTVRQRVARHLLDLASEGPNTSQLVAAIGQRDLAEAAGTVREVVARTLGELRADGLLRTQRDRIILLDPERLAQEAYPAMVANRVPLE